MSSYHQLLVFADGDVYNPSTWSNVPYMFISAFETEFPNIPVRTCNINADSFFVRALSKVYNKLITPFLGPMCTFSRTNFYSFLMQRKMKKSIVALDSSPAVLLSFDFSNLPACRSINDCAALFCDWTIEYEIREHQKRIPTHTEKKLIRRQNSTLCKADHVTSLFPYAAKYIEEKCCKKCYYSGKHKNVDKHAKAEINITREGNNRFLFIGNKAYLPGLRIITKAIERYNEYHLENDRIYLDGIGMTNAVGDFDRHVVFHGYLNKKKSAEASEYYSLIYNARALITVSDKWVGASSIMEAMSLGTPVIISPNKELKEMFGEEISFGWWSAPNPESVLSAIERSLQLSAEELRQMCEAAVAELDGSDWGSLVRRWAKSVGLEE